MNRAEFNILLQAYTENKITGEQWEQFREAIQSGAFDTELDADFAEYLKKQIIHPSWNSSKEEKVWSAIEADTMKVVPTTTPVHRVHFLKTAWFKYAAAIIILITGIATYFFIHTSQSQVEMAEKSPSPLPKEDVLPGSDRAILTLSNGEKVELNNAASETIKDGTLSIENINGQLVYGGNPPAPNGATPFSKGGVAGSLTYNTMRTPNGGQYKLTLSDGTKVWLNAASSITYPIAFTQKTREVSITGEAYFEVAKNAKQPFMVSIVGGNQKTPGPHSPFEKGGSSDSQGNTDSRGISEPTRIEVLGTSFNVNAYENEVSKTSLMEGSIKINNHILQPNQAFTNGKVIATNTAKDIAWKNGSFYFDGTTFQELARQLERWYDIKIVYAGNPPMVKLRGEMDMGVKLSGVCRFLNEVGIATEIKDRTLIISKAQH
jgi:transmembrane sensor